MISIDNYFAGEHLFVAKYSLPFLQEFMMINDVPRTLCERVLDYVVSKWANTKGVDQERVLKVNITTSLVVTIRQSSFFYAFASGLPKRYESRYLRSPQQVCTP